jgi:hypothetical protein
VLDQAAGNRFAADGATESPVGGAIDRAVADTDATPSTALVRILSTVQVWVNGVAQDAFFAGLTPGQFGLYRSILGRTGHTSAGRRSEYGLANGRQNGVGAREDKPRPITLTQVMGSRC